MYYSFLFIVQSKSAHSSSICPLDILSTASLNKRCYGKLPEINIASKDHVVVFDCAGLQKIKGSGGFANSSGKVSSIKGAAFETASRTSPKNSARILPPNRSRSSTFLFLRPIRYRTSVCCDSLKGARRWLHHTMQLEITRLNDVALIVMFPHFLTFRPD